MPRWWRWLAWTVFAGMQAGWLAWAYGAVFSPTGRYDFASYYAAARALRYDPHANIYADSVIQASGAAVHIVPLPYTYPPLAALLLVPLTTLSFAAAAHLWLIPNLVLWQIALFLLAREAAIILRDALHPADVNTALALPNGVMGRLRLWWRDPARAIASVLSALVFLFARPAAVTMSLGQINFVVLVPLALVPWLLRTQRTTWVGVMLAFAAMIKLTPILLLGYLWLRGRTQAFVSGLIVLGLLTLFSLAVVGPQTLLALIGQVRRISAMDAALPHNEALFAVPLHLIEVNLPALVAVAHAMHYAGLMLLAGGIGLWLYQPRHEPSLPSTPPVAPHQDNAAYALALCGMLLLSPATWSHHYLWLLPALVLALALSLRQALLADRMERPMAWRQLWLVVATWLITGFTLPLELDGQLFLRTTMVLGLSLTDWSHWLRPLATLLLALQLATFLPTPRIGLRVKPSQRSSDRTNDHSSPNGI